MKWLRAGLYAGALLGAADVLGALARGVGGLGTVRALQLILLGASWMGLAGLLAGGLIAGGAFLANRAGRWRGVVAGGLAALAASPAVFWDAFAVFQGHRAASIKGHGKLSLAIVAVALLALFELARRCDRLLVRLEDAPAGATRAGQPGSGRPVWRARVLAGLLLAVAAVGAGREPDRLAAPVPLVPLVAGADLRGLRAAGHSPAGGDPGAIIRPRRSPLAAPPADRASRRPDPGDLCGQGGAGQSEHPLRRVRSHGRRRRALVAVPGSPAPPHRRRHRARGGAARAAAAAGGAKAPEQ